jgi:hypothetical protein
MSMPKRAFVDAHLHVGDRMRVRADGDGRVVFERIDEERTAPLPFPPHPDSLPNE